MKKVLAILIFAALVCYFFYQQGIGKPAATMAEDHSFVIKSGESVKQIGINLKEAGLIKSTNYYHAYIWLNGLEAKLQAGEYLLSPAMTIKEIVDALISGQALSQEKTLKIIEGWDISDISAYLINQKIIAGTDYNRLANSPVNDWQFDFSKPDFLSDAPIGADLEGFLFPDTYRIYEDASAQEIIKKMLDNFGQKLSPEMRADIKSQDKTIGQIITMASLVEKEVRTEEDMKIVSGIFWDRIKNGQALESCATLAYILGENKKQYTKEDTEIASPYNTYRNQGLPPGPISNPGLNAIKAAIYPKYTEYNYFLSRFDNGETIFSQTYEEHLANKAKYLK